MNPERRKLLQAFASAVVLAGLPKVAGAWSADFAAIDLPASGLDERQWVLIGLVQEHLLPTEPEAPGARQVNALKYAQWVLSDPAFDVARKKIWRDGLAGLDAILSTQKDLELALRQLETHDIGRAWLLEQLNMVLEALLTDPVYGGNPDEIGWRWLRHQPGFRRPTPDKRYFLL